MAQDPIIDENEHSAIVSDVEAGTRLDAFLALQFPAFSRNRIKDLILEGVVQINGITNSTPKYKVKEGESIILSSPEPVDADPEPQNIPLEILYEDEHLIVINKPTGMVVHPAPGNMDGTLVNALLYHCGDSLKGIGGVKRPGIVHRLDKDTSGVMVAAKTAQAHNGLAEQFADHGRTGPLERSYTCFVWGQPNPLYGTMETLIGRDPHNRLKQSVLKSGGRESITHYEVQERYGDERWQVSKVTCTLETGRTHQIRVHLTHLGHPLLGDQVYGMSYATKINILPEQVQDSFRALGRQALHASLLGFEHPHTGEHMVFESPLPDDLQELDDLLQDFTRA